MIHPHSLRHFFATDSLEEGGATLKEVRAQLGHKSIKTTARYWRLTRDGLAKAHRRFSPGARLHE